MNADSTTLKVVISVQKYAHKCMLMRLKYQENKPMPATTNNWNQSIKKKPLHSLRPQIKEQ
jgi:hypothetical protein